MPKRILIAEDEMVSRELLSLYATKKGYDVVSVIDGVDLLKKAATEHFDVIITDLMMANLNGASAAEIMKMQGNTTPVIAITALSPAEMQLVADKFTRIYYKPCDFKELFGFVESLLGENKAPL
jgi:DNA-binding response OmpR family regulator